MSKAGERSSSDQNATISTITGYIGIMEKKMEATTL